MDNKSFIQQKKKNLVVILVLTMLFFYFGNFFKTESEYVPEYIGESSIILGTLTELTNIRFDFGLVQSVYKLDTTNTSVRVNPDNIAPAPSSIGSTNPFRR